MSDEDAQDGIYPSLIPNWDHTPRSGKAGSILINANPDLFEKHAEMVLNFSKINNKDFVFIKSWNEWGEGNYMEPDLKYGKGFIEALRRVVDKVLLDELTVGFTNVFLLHRIVICVLGLFIYLFSTS